MEDTEHYDVILDMVARSPHSRSIQTLPPKGRYFTANPRVSGTIRSFATSMFTSRSASFEFAGETSEELTALKAKIEDGKIMTKIDRVFPIENAIEAHQRVESDRRLGSVILTNHGN